MIDLLVFNSILILTTNFLPYFGLYKFIFNLNSFFIFDLDLRIDLEVSSIIYSEHNFCDNLFNPCNYYKKQENKFQLLKNYVHNLLLNNFII